MRKSFIFAAGGMLDIGLFAVCWEGRQKGVTSIVPDACLLYGKPQLSREPLVGCENS
jgi:hypothetical protein